MKKHELTSKLIQNCLEHARSKDETRPFLQAHHFSEELRAQVTCDGHRLTLSRRFYNPDLAGKTLFPDFSSCGREYPRVQNVIPDLSKLSYYTVRIAPEHAIGKASGTPTRVYFYLDDSTSSNHIISTTLIPNLTPAIILNSYYLKPLIQHSKYPQNYLMGIKRSDNGTPAQTPAAFLLDDNANHDDFYLVMPMKE